MQDLSHIFDIHHSSRQHWIPHPVSKARDRTRILMDTSWIWFCCATMGTPWNPGLYPVRFSFLLFFPWYALMFIFSLSPSLKKKKGKKKEKKEFQSWLRVHWTTSKRRQVWALSLFSGLRIQRCHELCCRSQMWLWSCIAVAVVWAGRYSCHSTPSLRTSICCEYGPGKKKKQHTNVYTYFLFKIYMF